MNVTVPIFHRKKDGLLTWASVGLGGLGFALTMRSEARLRRSFVDRLKAAVGEAPPHALRALLGPQRIRLERLRLELTLRDPDRRGKRKRTGVFPIVLDTRYRTGDERLRFAYHPLRQLEVLAIDERQELAPQLAAFFGDRWGALDDDGLEALKAHARDRVAPLALSVKPRSLLDQLERRKKSVWDDLKVDPTRGKKGKAPRRGQPSLLRRLGRDLTERAASELLELGRPREPQRSQLQQLLCVPHPRSLALLGPPGVGKRTLLRRAIDDLLRHDGFDAHRNLDEVTHVWELAASRLIAGMSYLGQWEQRCVEIVEAVRGRRVILAFEDLHTLGRVGRSKESERSMADFFRGPVQRGELVLLGTATPAQWRRLEEDAPAFASLFGTLRVEPASATETRRMLLHEARRLEAERPELTFEPEAFRAILEHGAPLLANQALPGKALDLLHALAGGSSVDEQAVLHLLTQRTGLMADLIAPLEGDDRQSAVEDLAAEVMGQPEAVEAAADLVTRIRAGLTDPGRPWGAYLFTGPTGTGKTQLTKTLASYLFGDDRLVRFDMGELSGPDAVARLIGDRWEPRGMLTEAVRQQPFCVLLLDEIEKAHPSVLYLLLQLLDDGRLTDATGELVDFRHAVVVLTSNLGARARPAVGFGEESAASVEAEVTKAVKDFFPPELFNRIERIVPFRPLGDEVAAAIADKELAALLGRRGLTERNVFVFAHQSATERMAREAFDSRAGARSVRRYLETRVASLLAEHLAATARPEMELIRLYDRDGAYRLRSEALREAEPRPGDSPLRPLLDQPAAQLRGALADALERLDRLREDGLEALGERIAGHLAKASESARDADAVYLLDGLRREADALRERLEAAVRADELQREAELELATQEYVRGPIPEGALHGPRTRFLDRRMMRAQAPRPLDRRAILSALAEVALLERAVREEDDLGAHRVHVELLRVGHARHRTALGLFGDLCAHYADLAAEVSGGAALQGDQALRLDPEEAPRTATDLLVLDLTGVALRRRLESEVGCHVLSSITGGSEVVRVRVLPADRPATERIEAFVEARARFEAALEAGEDSLPESPEALAPVVRRVRFDRPLRGGERAPMELEDYRLGHVTSGEAQRPLELFGECLWLGMSWEEPRP